MYKLNKTYWSYLISLLMKMLLVMLFSSSVCFSATLVDYENGRLQSTSGGAFRYYFEDRSVLTLEPNQGMDGTNQSLRVHTLLDNFHIWWIQNSQQRDLIPEGRGCNRMSFFIKIPENYPISSRNQTDNNFHLGTYTRDPQIPSNIQGVHYYHLYNIQGSAYPIKFIANERPQHKVGVRATVSTNPESWNYFDGFTRFYLELLPLYECPIQLPFDSFVDEVKFYSTSEPENDETISSISCTYQGNGLFQIGWHGNSNYEHNGHRYEVRYSTSPITNANYSSATVAPGGPFSLHPGSYNFMLAEFSIQVQDNTRYYFAIKDIDSNIPYVSKIDYPLGDVGPMPSEGPIVSDIDVRSIFYNSASIHWETDKVASSQIEYGLDTNYGNITQIANSGSPVASHNIALSELAPGTLYHYRVRSRDASGNEGISDDNTFETLRTQTQESSVILESEDGWILSTMQLGTDIYASKGKYIAAPSGTGTASTPVANVTYNIDIKVAGDYYIWLLMNGPTASNDAIYVGVNGNYDRVYPSQNGQYEWVRVETANNSANYVHSLASGINLIALSHTEELARADKLLVTRSTLTPEELILMSPKALQFGSGKLEKVLLP